MFVGIITTLLGTLSAATDPSCYYRFESAATALVDSAGNRNITSGNEAAAPTIQQADTTSVGGFAVFGYGLEGRTSGWPATRTATALGRLKQRKQS